MRHTTLLLALAALAATSCSLQFDSQYGLRWDRRVTVPQGTESDVTEPQPEVEPEVVQEWYTSESDPQTEPAQPVVAPGAADFEVSLPFGIHMDDLPEAVAPQIERRLEMLNEQKSSGQQTKQSLATSTGAQALKIAAVVLGICFLPLGILALFIGYLISFFDSDQANELYQLGVLLIVLGGLLILIPQLL
jgi:hypothetical protein